MADYDEADILAGLDPARESLTDMAAAALVVYEHIERLEAAGLDDSAQVMRLLMGSLYQQRDAAEHWARQCLELRAENAIWKLQRAMEKIVEGPNPYRQPATEDGCQDQG